MRKPAFMYRNVASNRLSMAMVNQWKRIDQSPLHDPAKRVLRAASAAASTTLETAAVSWRRSGKKVVGETSWQFVAAFGASDEAVLPGYGVVYWAFVGRYYADRWPDSHEALVHAAQAAVPMANDIERRMATYGPFTGRARSMYPPFDRVDDEVDEDTQHARFQFRLIEAVHEATLGRHVTRGDVSLPAMPGWTAGYEIGLDTFQDVLSSPELNGPMPS